MELAMIFSLLLALEPPQTGTREAFAPLHELIGTWKASGQPQVNNPAERRRGSWSELITWRWQLKGEPRLEVEFQDGKLFQKGTLRYRPEEKQYELSIVTPAEETQVFAGTLGERQLTLLRTDAAATEDERLVLQWLHGSRMIYSLETKPKSARTFSKRFQVGATKEGAEFGKAGSGNECVVTGGSASIAVTYQGKTYYVCCSGCKEAFEENPAQILKEYAERKAKEKQ